MIKLFDNKVRFDLEPSLHNENVYDYYDRSAKQEVSNIRELLNKWFIAYPISEQNELKSRFKKTFSSAFYELFIFHLFINQGFEIQVHPKVPNSNKRPDFLLKKGDVEFYLEAKEATNKSQSEMSKENMYNQIYDSLNKIKSPNFYLCLEELEIKSINCPSTKKVIQKIESEMLKYDPDILEKEQTKVGIMNSAKIEFKNDELKLVVQLIPKNPSERHIDNGFSILLYPSISGWGGAEVSIQEAITKKSKRYGKLNKPYFICINATGIVGNGDYDVTTALFGSPANLASADPNHKIWGENTQPAGIFFGKNGRCCKNVTGVLVTKVMELNIDNARHWFVLNPFPNKEIDINIIDLSYIHWANGIFSLQDKKTIGEIFKLEDRRF